MGILQEKPYQARGQLDLENGWLYGSLIPGLALAVHDYLLSPLILIIGVTVLAWSNFQQKTG